MNGSAVKGPTGVKGVPGREMSIGEEALFAHYFRLNLPAGDAFASGLDANDVYDHPLTTMPAADRSHLGIFYPILRDKPSGAHSEARCLVLSSSQNRLFNR